LGDFLVCYKKLLAWEPWLHRDGRILDLPSAWCEFVAACERRGFLK